MRRRDTIVKLSDDSPLAGLACPEFEVTPFVKAPALSKARVAIISTAGLARRSDAAFEGGAAGYRVIPGDTASSDLVMSHVSLNFDRTGFQQDLNVIFPIDRLNEMATAGEIGSVAEFHYSFMGATDPEKMEDAARDVAMHLKADKVDVALLVPV